VSADEIDAYLGEVPGPERAALEALRAALCEELPDAEQCLSYRVPAFRVGGIVAAGFAAFTSHLSYLPFSGGVLEVLGSELDGYERTKSSLHFSVARPLQRSLVHRLVEVRLAEIATRGR